MAGVLGEEAVRDDRLEMESILTLDADLAALRFRRLASNMAVLVMQAALKPVQSLSDHAALLERHRSNVPVDAEYLARLDRLQR